jgi:hypothetical protein
VADFWDRFLLNGAGAPGRGPSVARSERGIECGPGDAARDRDSVFGGTLVVAALGPLALLLSVSSPAPTAFPNGIGFAGHSGVDEGRIVGFEVQLALWENTRENRTKSEVINGSDRF